MRLKPAGALLLILLAASCSKPQTAAEWVDAHMNEPYGEPDPVTGEVTTFGDTYYTLQEAPSGSLSSNLTTENMLLAEGLSFESEPTLQAVEQEMQARWDQLHPATPQTDREACIDAGG